jgi:hypothetical protein
MGFAPMSARVRRTGTAVLIVASLLVACARKPPPPAADAGVALEPGQIWSYETRPGEESSLLTILKVEPHPKHGTIVHVSLEGLRLKIPSAQGGSSSTIGHLPFQEAALRGSLLKMVTRTAAPTMGGYKTWKDAFDQGRAGIWSDPVAKTVGTIERLANEQPAR